jgi:hypothetical protein
MATTSLPQSKFNTLSSYFKLLATLGFLPATLGPQWVACIDTATPVPQNLVLIPILNSTFYGLDTIASATAHRHRPPFTHELTLRARPY